MVTLAIQVFAGGLLQCGSEETWCSLKALAKRRWRSETDLISLSVQVPETNLLYKSSHVFRADAQVTDRYILMICSFFSPWAKTNSNLANNHH